MLFSHLKHLHHHNACGHQSWQGGDLPWGVPTHKITWPINHGVLLKTYPLPQCIWPQNVTGWWYSGRASIHKVTWSLKPVHVRLCEKIKSLNLHYHNVYGKQSWLGGDIKWVAPTPNVTWSFSHVVVWSHTTK